MALPFVRELFADVEKLPAFRRAASHLREGAGRINLSGLTPTAKALLLVLLQRASERPLIVVVTDNRAAENLVPILQSFAELTGSTNPESVVALPARDVLPFQNLSPHPEIQEARATALWKIATGAASIIVSPVAATTIRLRSPEYYSDLARIVRRSETLDVDALLQHLKAQPVGVDKLGLHIRHPVTFVLIQLTLREMAFPSGTPRRDDGDLGQECHSCSFCR